MLMGEGAVLDASDASFEEFVAVHGPGLLVFARALTGNTVDAEDLLQGALTSAYVRWPRIRADGALAYVRRSVANGRVSLWRRSRRRDLFGFELETPALGRHDEETVERLAVRETLSRLPRGQRAVLVMRYLLDLSDAEIADILGVTLSGVRSQAHRGLRTLRDQWEPDRSRPGPPGSNRPAERSATAEIKPPQADPLPPVRLP
jgi:RNA polymerase sigma-70 factor (sigma-E family)